MRLQAQLYFRFYRLLLIIAFVAALMFSQLISSFMPANLAFAEAGTRNTKSFSARNSIDSKVTTHALTLEPPKATRPAKRIPNNAATPAYTEAMAASDSKLAAVFGGLGAVAAGNSFEPPSLGSSYPLYRGDLIDHDGKIRRGHLSYAMHLYGSADGTGDVELYVPLGFISHSRTPTPTDAAVTFYYPRLGSFINVTLAVFHVANFHLSYEDERVCIGTIGGRGGSLSSYRHSHLEFYHGDTGLPPASERETLRIDPAAVFHPSQTNTSAMFRSKK
ncbi:MAG TPA: hypothetical protein VEW46_13610 [Pyrinomonadaceae bacterium]|nr:hypothetical protein [Pyrinomonadaceae bacterium]